MFACHASVTSVVSGGFAYFGTGCPTGNDSESLLAWSLTDAPRTRGYPWAVGMGVPPGCGGGTESTMKSWIRVLTLAALIAGSLASGCVTFQEPQDAAGMSASKLAEDVTQRLQDDPIASQSTYGVDVEGGIVTIRGSVPSDVVRARVVGVARSTPGVIDVVDRMTRW